MRQCLNQSWTPGSSRQVFHICDAPEHGKEFTSSYDRYPKGSPTGLKIPELMKEFKDKDIAYTLIKLNDSTNLMIKCMQKHHS